MGLLVKLLGDKPDREARRAKYWRILIAMHEEEEHRIKYGYYKVKAFEELAYYGTCLVERMEEKRPEVLRDLAEELEKLLPAPLVYQLRKENDYLPNMTKWERRYIIRLLSCIDVHTRQNLGLAVQRIEAAAGAELVKEERFYIWVESGAVFTPPECPRPAELEG